MKSILIIILYTIFYIISEYMQTFLFLGLLWFVSIHKEFIPCYYDS